MSRGIPSLVVALVLALAALIIQVVSLQGTGDRPRIEADGTYRVGTLPAGTDAVQAAVDATPLILGYDYRRLAKDVAAARATMTPSFGREFARTFNRTVTSVAPGEKAVTKALVRGAALRTSTSTSATVVVYVDQILSSTTTAKQKVPGKVSQSRVAFTLTKHANRWLVAGINPQ